MVITVKNPGGLTPKDLTGYSLRMHIRESIDSDTIIMELTNANARLLIRAPASAGVIDLLVSAADTALLPCNNDFQSWVYDLEIYKSDDTVRVMQGGVTVHPEVTR